MHRKDTNSQLIKSSSKVLEFTKGKLEILKNSTKKRKIHLPPISYTPKPKIPKCYQVNQGTLSIIKQEKIKTRRNSYFIRSSANKSTRNKLKLKTIHWILSNYREEIDRLLDNCKLLIQECMQYGSINHQTFEDIMNTLEFDIEKTLIDRLF